MTRDETRRWLEKDIPHRVRVCLARGKLLSEQLGHVPDPSLKTREDVIARRCETDAIWEGRLVATRWLIDLCGLRADKNKLAAEREKSTKYPHDFRVDQLPNGAVIDPRSTHAQFLADVWRGCSQAGSHPTHDSGHPSVEPEELDRALRIIASHLDATVYRDEPRKILELALQPPP